MYFAVFALMAMAIATSAIMLYPELRYGMASDAGGEGEKENRK